MYIGAMFTRTSKMGAIVTSGRGEASIFPLTLTFANISALFPQHQIIDGVLVGIFRQLGFQLKMFSSTAFNLTMFHQ